MTNQVLVLAGGESSRFYPFNENHKSLFTLAGKTILQRTIENILNKYDSEIIVVLGDKKSDEERKIIEDFKCNCDIKFAIQKEPLGMADAILSAKEYLKGDFFVINSQQIDFCNYADQFVEKIDTDEVLAVIGSQNTKTPWNFGIIEFQNEKPVGIIEKPEKGSEPSSQRVVGIYLFDNRFLKELEKTPVSQYSLEETLNRIAKQNNLSTVEINNTLLSLKYPWDLFLVKDEILKNIGNHIDESAEIAKTAIIKGNVYVDKNAKIYDYSIIEGPAYIGENAIVGAYCQVRGGTALEKNSAVQRYVDVKNSIIGENSSVHSGFVGGSIIGSNVKIGAGFTVANKRLDRKNVKVVVKGEKVDAGINNLGVMIGNNSSVGINVSSMPGTIVGPNSLVYPKLIIK